MATTEIISIEGIDKVEAKLLATKLLGRPLPNALRDLGKIAQTAAKGGAPHHTKISRRTSAISVTVKALGADAATMEIGRRAGAKMPPKNVIENWCNAKGIDAGSAFVIARSIKRRGLKGRFFMKHAAEVVTAALPTRIDQMRRDVEGEFSA